MNWSKWFYYDETSKTGLRWIVKRYGGTPNNRILVRDIGDVAGCITHNGYGEVKLEGKSYKTHRVIYELFFGKIPLGSDIDHIDGVRANNRPNNLRLCNDKINSQNRTIRKDSLSGVTGVSKTSRVYKGTTRWYYMSRWTDIYGAEKSKSFRIDVYGEKKAFELACKCRSEAILNLVAQGQFYTERHGK